MYSYAPTSDFDRLQGGCVVALGCFDGLHIGHRTLLCQAKQLAKAEGLPLVVYSPEAKKGQALLTTPKEKEALLYGFGADLVILADFEKIKGLSAEQFVCDVLWERLHCRIAVCGYNFRFGAKAAGDCVLLSVLLRDKGAETVVLPAVRVADQDVSSTRIRSLLLDGNVEGANELLEKPYCLSGAVRHGRQIGRTLGFPTANLAFPEGKLVPKHGVYYAHAHTHLGVFGAICNIGLRPTFDDTPPKPVLEAHLLDFSGDLYEQQIQIRFIRFLRPEMRFPDPDALADAVRRDIQTAKDLAASDPILTKETI